MTQSCQVESLTNSPLLTCFSRLTGFVDGSIYLATPQDTLFHIVPHLKRLTTTHSLPLQDILDSLPPPLSTLTPVKLLTTICDCTPSSNSFVPDTFRLSPTRVLNILVRKVDALIPVLGGSIVTEFVEKAICGRIDQQIPKEVEELAKRKCAMEIISADLDEDFTKLLFESTEYIPPPTSP